MGEPGGRLVKIHRHRTGGAEKLKRICAAGDNDAAAELVAVFKGQQVAAAAAERDCGAAAASDRAGIDDGARCAEHDPGVKPGDQPTGAVGDLTAMAEIDVGGGAVGVGDGAVIGDRDAARGGGGGGRVDRTAAGDQPAGPVEDGGAGGAGAEINRVAERGVRQGAEIDDRGGPVLDADGGGVARDRRGGRASGAVGDQAAAAEIDADAADVSGQLEGRAGGGDRAVIGERRRRNVGRDAGIDAADPRARRMGGAVDHHAAGAEVDRVGFMAGGHHRAAVDDGPAGGEVDGGAGRAGAGADNGAGVDNGARCAERDPGVEPGDQPTSTVGDLTAMAEIDVGGGDVGVGDGAVIGDRDAARGGGGGGRVDRTAAGDQPAGLVENRAAGGAGAEINRVAERGVLQCAEIDDRGGGVLDADGGGVAGDRRGSRAAGAIGDAAAATEIDAQATDVAAQMEGGPGPYDRAVIGD